MKRKFAAIDGRGVISVQEGDVPEHGHDGILVEVRASLVSPGTELSGIKRKRANPSHEQKARPFGYQNAGVVLEKGVNCTPDGHRMGCITIVGGCSLTTKYASKTGNLDVRSSARTGPGYHDEAWEFGRDYPPVFIQWDTQRNLRLCLRLMQEGRLHVESLITHRVPLAQAPAACENLLEHPEKALGVILLPE